MPRMAPLLPPASRHRRDSEDGRRPLHRYSGRKGNWTPYYYDEVVSRREQWQFAMRQRVIETAVALLAEVGPRRFTVLEVARRSGIGRTTIYKHFGLKAELLAACRHAPGGPSTRQLQRTAARHGRWIDQLLSPSARKMFQGRTGRPPTKAEKEQKLPPALTRLRQMLLGLAAETKDDGDLWLLVAAEGVRSRRRPRHYRAPELPLPLPSRAYQLIMRQVIAVWTGGEVPEETDLQVLTRWLGALWWYYLSIRGPHRDTGPGTGPAVAAEAEEELALALSWLLRGVGMGQHREAAGSSG